MPACDPVSVHREIAHGHPADPRGGRAEPQCLMQHLHGVAEPGYVVGCDLAVAERAHLGGHPVLHLGMVSQHPQRVGEGGRRGVVARQHEDQQVVDDVVIGNGLPCFGIGCREQRVHERRIQRRVCAARLQHVVGDAAQRRHRRTRAGPCRRRQPPRRAHRTQRTVGGVGRRDVHVLGDDIVAIIQVEPQNRAAKRPHGHPSTVDVEVDFPTLRPAVAQRLRGPRHVTTEVADVRLGEDRLQCPLSGQPRLVAQDEQAVARQMLHFLVHDASLGGRVVAAQHVADTAG